MDDAAQESQCFGDVAAVVADAFFGRANVGGEKGLHAARFGKDIGRMAQLGSLDDHRGLESEDVFVTEQIKSLCAPAELTVEKVVVVGSPVDRSNIEVSRDSQVPANPLEVSPLYRFPLDTLADPGKRVRELAETMIGLAGRFHLFGCASGQLDGQAAGHGSLPLDQLPLAAPVAILACLDKRGLDLHLGRKEMLPLVPCLVPGQGHGGLVHQDLQLSARIPVQRPVAVELKLAQGCPEAALPALGKEGCDPPDKEGLAVTRSVAQHNDRSETAVGKERRRRRVRQKTLVTGSQLRVGQDVEGPFGGREGGFGSVLSAQLQLTKSEGQA